MVHGEKDEMDPAEVPHSELMAFALSRRLPRIFRDLARESPPPQDEGHARPYYRGRPAIR